MFYSNALSVRRKLLKIKKETRSIRRPPGKKKGWPGEVKVLKKGPNQFEGAEKKKVPKGGVWSPDRALCFC